MIGLNEMFFEDGDDQIGQSTGQGAVYSSSYKTRPKNCAGSLDLPPLPRQQSNLVGFLNQGATCYLNSLFQTLFLTPQLRQAIYALPICEGSVDNFSDFLSGKRREILFNIQKLFVRLQEEDSRSISTEELTKAFGWVNSEEMAQQDVQELNRVLFDTIERSLKDTPYEALIDELYRGNLSHMIVCQQCGTIRKREEKFLDLMLQVKNCKGVEESLQRLFEMETLTDDNKLFCDTCNEKTSTLKGQRIEKLPPVLTFGLARFDIDYQRWERYKVNDRFEYPLELDLQQHLDPESLEVPENCQYELKSIIIHRGGAHGGHYYAYIQDELKEGNWYLEMPAEFQKDPKLVEKVKYDPKRFMTEEQIKKAEEDKLNGVDTALQINLEEKQNQETETTKQEDNNNDKNKNNNKGKNNKKGNNKKGNNKQQNQQNQNNSSKKQEKKKKVEVEYDYDECDFPIPYSEKRLIENWYNFDDSSVTPILPGKLQSQFGGSNQNAYILVYRQKKISTHLQNEKPPQIPEVWKPAIQSINEINLQQRAYYLEVENQLDIVIQDEALFKIDPETYFIQYVEDSKIEEQGLKLRLKFTDKVSEAKQKIAELLNTQNFHLFEVDRLRSGNCQVLHDLSKIDENLDIKEGKITHLSTWIVVKDDGLAQQLSQITGEDVVPIKIKLRFYGEEIEQFVYNNLTMQEFIQKVESITSIPANQVSLKIVEDTMIRRIDRQIMNFENPHLPNTLKDVKVADGTAILVEMKDENQLEQEADDIQQNLNQALKNSEKDFVDLDDTENIRTVIVNKEFEESDFVRFQINIDWNLKQLNDFIVKELKLEEPQRMRNLTTCRLFVKEELDTQLRNYPDFQSGGARIQIESGRYPTIQEIVIKAVVYKKEDELKQFYLPANFSVKECKDQMAKEFGVDPSKHTLYRVDHLEEPAFPLRREKQEITKCHVSSGDLLILKSDTTLSADEKLILHIHMTMTGQPEDSQYLDKLEVNKEYTLKDLKEIVLSMPQFDFAKNYPIEQIRVREKQNNMFFGKIFRDVNKTLKSLQFQNNSQIVIQVLQQPEKLDNNTMILLVSRRNVETRTYGQKLEMLFRHQTNTPLIADLEKSVKQFFNIGEEERISIAKYFPHKFEWKWMDKNEEIIEKKKKGKETTIIAGSADLKKVPFFLKDGDIIGVRFESENVTGDDDFQTAEDLVLREEFNVRKEQERIEKENEQKRSNANKKSNKRQEGAGIFIRLEEDYPLVEQQQQSKDDSEKTESNPGSQNFDSKDESNADTIQKQD